MLFPCHLLGSLKRIAYLRYMFNENQKIMTLLEKATSDSLALRMINIAKQMETEINDSNFLDIYQRALKLEEAMMYNILTLDRYRKSAVEISATSYQRKVLNK